MDDARDWRRDGTGFEFLSPRITGRAHIHAVCVLQNRSDACEGGGEVAEVRVGGTKLTGRVAQFVTAHAQRDVVTYDAFDPEFLQLLRARPRES